MTMKILALTTLLAGLLTLPALADTPAGWHALIVGDSLAGWVDGDGKAVSPGTWKVADGVLHLTGKGGGKDLGSGRGGLVSGVLRDAVPRWLNEGPNRRIIRGFSHAVPKDGGQGALYVLLKRLG